MTDAMRTRRKLCALVLAAICVPTAVSAFVQPGSKAALIAKWDGPVALKKPLYSIAYGFGSGNGQAITVLSPDKGTFYQIRLLTNRDDGGIRVGEPLADRVPARLSDKVAAARGAGASIKLLTYKSGERFRCRLRFDDQKLLGDERTRMIVDLRDDLSGDIVTQIRLEWPTVFSADFSEAKQIDQMISEFLSRGGTVKGK